MKMKYYCNSYVHKIYFIHQYDLYTVLYTSSEVVYHHIY
jgi:hypothetical protein